MSKKSSNQENQDKIKVQTMEGYKQTEVGVIPVDWYVLEFGHTCLLSKKRMNPIISDEYKCVELEHISQRTGRLLGYANSKHLKSQKSKFIRGDILFGKLRPYLKKFLFPDFEGVCTTEIWVLKPKDNISNQWLFYLVQSKWIDEAANLSEGTKMPRADWGTVSSKKIPLPPTKAEQTAIATALSDMDALIEGLEKLLVKKRNIKQGAMQELLKPKEGWEKEKLPDVCWFQEGPGLRNWQFTKQGIKVINVTNLVNGYLDLSRTDRHISMQEFEKMYKHFEIDENDIVMASSGNSYSKVAVVRKQDLRLLMNTSVIRFKPLNGLDYNYLLIFLKSNIFKNQIDLLITGGAQPNFGPYHLKKIEIPLPKTKSEQTHIAQILSDMDAEIVEVEYWGHYHNCHERVPGNLEIIASTHPVVYVGGHIESDGYSGEGAHANYPNSQTWKWSKNLIFFDIHISETVDGNGMIIDFNNYNNIVIIPNIDFIESESNINWMHFRSFWGNVRSYPTAGEWAIPTAEFGNELLKLIGISEENNIRAAASGLSNSNIAPFSPYWQKKWEVVY